MRLLNLIPIVGPVLLLAGLSASALSPQGPNAVMCQVMVSSGEMAYCEGTCPTNDPACGNDALFTYEQGTAPNKTYTAYCDCYGEEIIPACCHTEVGVVSDENM